MDDSFVSRSQETLAKDTSVVPEFWQQKYRSDASRNWDRFYHHNTTNFFKNRHWTDRVFEELRPGHSFSEKKPILLEIGCGVGNFVWPVLERNPDIFIYACDFSKRAIEFVKQNEGYAQERCQAFVCDITKDRLADTIPPHSVDIVSAIFVFSALPPEKQAAAISNIVEILKPGGRILFRDYGIYDIAQLRFKSGHKLENNLYVRQDGTLAYYFSKERLHELFVQHGGLVELDNDYVISRLKNIKKNIDVERVFTQARFQSPIDSALLDKAMTNTQITIPTATSVETDGSAVIDMTVDMK